MFSSEQVFEVSGTMDQLEMAIRFAFNMSELSKDNISYQITKDGKYCIGWLAKEGWKKYPFDFDPHIVSEIVEQHLRKQKYGNPYSYDDGSTEKGFLMKAIPQLFSDEEDGIKSPFYGIVSIEPYMNFFAK